MFEVNSSYYYVLRRFHTTVHIMAQRTTLQEFEGVFPKLEEVLLDHAKQFNLPEEYLKWYQKVSSSDVALEARFAD